MSYDPDDDRLNPRAAVERMRRDREEEWHGCARCRTTTLHATENGETRCVECGHLLQNGDDE